jgi:hypothetical protein
VRLQCLRVNDPLRAQESSAATQPRIDRLFHFLHNTKRPRRSRAFDDVVVEGMWFAPARGQATQA